MEDDRSLFFHGASISRFEVGEMPDDFIRFYRSFAYPDWEPFVEWVIQNGFWNEIIVEVEQDQRYNISTAFWSAKEWGRVRLINRSMRSGMNLGCFMSPSATMHYRLKFGD